MKNKRSPNHKARIGTVKKSTLAIGMVVALAFSLIMGVTAIARGFGSIYPHLNLVAKPFVCGAGEMTHSRSVSDIGPATYYSARWYCEGAEIDATQVFLFAGIPYGLLLFAILLLITYLYWNSSVGPAKNGGPLLW
jgi:hypothetical protein